MFSCLLLHLLTSLCGLPLSEALMTSSYISLFSLSRGPTASSAPSCNATGDLRRPTRRLS